MLKHRPKGGLRVVLRWLLDFFFFFFMPSLSPLQATCILKQVLHDHVLSCVMQRVIIFCMQWLHIGSAWFVLNMGFLSNELRCVFSIREPGKGNENSKEWIEYFILSETMEDSFFSFLNFKISYRLFFSRTTHSMFVNNKNMRLFLFCTSLWTVIKT